MKRIKNKDRLQAIDVLMKSESLTEMSKSELIGSILYILNKKDIRANAQRLLTGATAKINQMRDV